MIGRRGFLTGIIAACAAPAIIRTPGLLMPIKPPLVGDGVPLFCTAHPITHSNLLEDCADLSEWALERMIVSLMQSKEMISARILTRL